MSGKTIASFFFFCYGGTSSLKIENKKNKCLIVFWERQKRLSNAIRVMKLTSAELLRYFLNQITNTVCNLPKQSTYTSVV